MAPSIGTVEFFAIGKHAAVMDLHGIAAFGAAAGPFLEHGDPKPGRNLCFSGLGGRSLQRASDKDDSGDTSQLLHGCAFVLDERIGTAVGTVRRVKIKTGPMRDGRLPVDYRMGVRS